MMVFAGLATIANELGNQKKKMDRPLFVMYGHKFHWAELFFICTALLGFTLMTLRFSRVAFPQWILALIMVIVSGTATGYVWNLCTQRKLSKTTEQLKRGVDRKRKENERLKATTSKITAHNEKFEQELEMIEESRVALGRSVVKMKQIEQKLEDIERTYRQLTEAREDFTQRLQQQIERANRLGTQLAEQNFEEKSLALFDMLLQEKGSGTTISGRVLLSRLRQELEKDGIQWTPELSDSFVGEIDKNTFSTIMKNQVKAHMFELDAAMRRAQMCKSEILQLDREIARLKTQLAERQVQEKKEKVFSSSQSGAELL